VEDYEDEIDMDDEDLEDLEDLEEQVIEEDEDGDNEDEDEHDDDDDEHDKDDAERENGGDHDEDDYEDDGYDDEEPDFDLFQGPAVRTLTKIADLSKHGTSYTAARGGRGGRGNVQLVSQYGYDNHIHQKAAKYATPGEPDKFYLELELKSIADVGLVGFPNAGKSSLLGGLSKAKPTIDNYPFTTLSPTVGRVEYSDNQRILLADIPGLIEGAGRGRGRGVEFLRHVERTTALMYVVDIHGGESFMARGGSAMSSPVRDLEVLVKELESYGDGSLLDRHAIVCCNKLDLLGNDEEREEAIQKVREASESLGLFVQSVRGVSALKGTNMGELAMDLRQAVFDAEESQKLENKIAMKKGP
jgi:GTP-binding protein